MKKLNQHGAVAMISVVIFSIIISILATAYVRAIINQQRESVNYDLSTRAYYAAESGVQDAIRALAAPDDSNGLADGKQDTCNEKGVPGQFLGGDGKLAETEELGYTCQLISSTPSELNVTTKQNETTLLRLNPNQYTGNAKLKIAWNKDDAQPREGDSKLLPPTTEWNKDGTSYYPMVRVTFISMPPNGSRSDIKQDVYFLNPTNTPDTSSPVISPVSEQDPLTVVQNSSCNGSGCEQFFTVPEAIFTGKVIYVAVNSVYDFGVTAGITMKDGAGDVIPFKETLADIDVTGRAGNVFRRVKQQVPISRQGSVPSYVRSSFDASAIIAGDGICKLFSIATTPSQYQNRCN